MNDVETNEIMINNNVLNNIENSTFEEEIINDIEEGI